MTYPTYVVNQDWTTFTANQPGASYTGNPNTYVYAVTGFGSIFKTIVDGNLDNPTRVPGAVGVATGDTLASPINLTAGNTIAVVKGDFVEEAAIAQAGADYTLDFSSIYDAENLSTKFVGSFVAATESNVGFVVSSKTVYFGAAAEYKKNADGKYVDIDGNELVDQEHPENGGVITNRTTITLNRTDTANKWGKDSTFTVGGDFLGDYTGEEAFATATAIVKNTALTVNGAVWVGSGWTATGSADELFENSSDAVRYSLTVDDSVVNAASLQVRNTGKLTVTNSTVNTVDVTIRHDASFTNTDLTVNAGAGNFNVYGETGVTATVTLTNSTLATNRTTEGNTDTQFNEFVIGKPGNANREGVVKLIGSKITGITTTTTGDNPETTVAKADITVNVGGTLDIDANSSVEAKDVVNKGNIIIKVKNDPESDKDQDWISASSFTNDNTTGAITIDTNDASLADWNGVKRVIYAENGSEGDAFEAKINVADGYKVRTSLGKVAIAKGVDYSVYYVNHANNEVTQFAETKTIDYPAENTDYYVAFNAFSDAGIAIGKRETQTTGDPDPKLTTTTILFDGTAEGLSYAGEIQDFDGLTFLRYGVDDAATTDVNEGTYDVTVAMTGAEQEGVERVIVKGFTVGEGVTFSADSVVQNGADASTDINGELKILKSNVTIVPDHPELGYVPSFRVGGGALNVHEGAKLTSELQGNLDVNATNRVPGSGTPIPATMTVDAADVDLYQLTIGSNATVTLQNMKIDDDTTTDIIEGGAHFNKLQLKNPESSDFAKPKLILQKTDVIVSEVFDSRYGTVDMDMKSTLRVLVDNATIGGGTFNLTVNGTATYDETTEKWTYTGDLADDLGFYKLVYAPLSADVVLTCNGVVNPDDKQEGSVTDKASGEVMGEYMYTSLGGKGLFVMKESLRENLYVNEAWTTAQYTFGDRIDDGIYFGVNGFNTLTEAFTTASSRNGNCTITLLSNVTENNLKAPFYKFKGSVTVTGDYSVTWDVTEQYSTYYDDGAAYFLRDGESTPTVTFDNGTSFKVTRTKTNGQTTTTNAGVLYVGYDAQDKTGAVFNGTIQDTTIYVSRWATLTVTGTVRTVTDGLASQIYLRKHGKLTIDGTGKTFEGPQVSTASSALIYGGTATVLNSVVSIGDQLKVVNRNALNEDDVNMPAETVVFGATNSTISAKSFDGGSVTPTANNDLTDGVTSLVKSTMTITNGVNNFGTFYVGVAVKAKDITEGETIVKNTVEVDDTITGEAAASTLIVGTTVSNNGVIELKYSTANITGELKNNAGGVITITDSTVNTSKVTNSATTDYGTINVNANGVLNVTTAGGLNNGGYGIMNVTGGTVSATHNSAAFWNYGIMNLNGAEFAFHDNIIRNSNVINVNGAVNVHDENNAMGKILANNANAKVVFGVSNTGTGAAEVKTNIQGGKVAFSAANLTFDMAVTEVDADEDIVSAKLSGGTIFVDKAGITLTDSGFTVVDTFTPDDPTTTDVNEYEVLTSHDVYNDTNAIVIGANGSLTLDDVDGWDNSDDEYADVELYDSLVVTGLDIAAGGLLTMDWSQCLTVDGDLNAETLTGGYAIEITLNPLAVYTALDTDKLVIAYDGFDDLDDYSFVKDYEAFFTVHYDEEDFVDGLYLDASKFVKVSQDHDADLEDGWYNQFNTVPGSQLDEDQGAVDSEAGVVLGIDGAFNNVFLKDKVTMIVGSEDAEATLTFTGIFAGGFDVSAMVEDTEYEAAGPDKLNMKIHEGKTEVLISAGTFSNAVVVGGDLVKIAGEETKVNYYRVGDIVTVIDGGIFTVTSAGGQRMIVGGEYYQAATIDGKKVSIGAANLTGDVVLTISGGSFKGYDVYGGNYANQKTFGKYAMIDGNVNLTLDSSDQALVFDTNVNGTQGGKIFAGSYGAGAITGDVTVTLTGEEDITLERLFGGCTGDIRKSTNELESNVEGNRILSFTGFTGDILNNEGEAAVIEGFDTVEFSGENELNFDVTGSFFNLDVTNWVFEADAVVTGTFAFDFSGDYVDLMDFTAENIGDGFTLANVTKDDATFFAYDDEALELTVADGTLTLGLAQV